MIQDSCQVLSYLTEKRITCSIPADCLFPNDDVGRGDTPLAMLAAPSCDTDFIDVFSALQYRGVGSEWEVHPLVNCLPLPRALQGFVLRVSMHAGLKKGWKTT